MFDTRTRAGRRGVIRPFLALAALVAAFLVPVAADASGCDPAFVAHSGRDWVVVPSGADDTANIQCALDEAAAAGRGADVRLAPGGYSAGLLTGTNLHGTFRGSGADVTRIEALPDLDCQSRIDIGRGTTWIYFDGGDVSVTDIAFEVTDPTPCAPWSAPFDAPGQALRTNLFGGIIQFGGPGTAGLTDCDDPTPHVIEAHVSDAAFYGPEFNLESTFPAVVHGVWFAATAAIDCPPVLWWPIAGSLSVQRSHFEGVRSGVEATAVVDGEVVVGGRPGLGNTFADVSEGVVAYQLSRSRMLVSHNDIHNALSWGVLSLQGDSAINFGYPVEQLSELDVRNNSITGVGFADGLGVIDLGALVSGEKTIDAQIVGNSIHLEDVFFGGVFGFGAHDVAVKNNSFTGAGGTAAVYHGVEGEPSGKWQIVGNDVSDFEGGVAAIWLGAGSFYDFVKTADPADDVLDEGVDNTVLGPRRTAAAGPTSIDFMSRLSDVTDGHR